MFKAILVGVALLWAGCASAAISWEITNVHLKDVVAAWDGSNNYYQVQIADNELPLSTGCGVTDSSGILSFWKGSGDFVNAEVVRWNVAVTAAATGAAVDLLVDTSTCNSTFGQKLFGVRLHQAL